MKPLGGVVPVWNHPVCAILGGFADFLDGAATPPNLGGEFMKRRFWLVAGLISASLLLAAFQQRPPSPQVEWLYYGGCQAGTRYSSRARSTSRHFNRPQIPLQLHNRAKPPPQNTHPPPSSPPHPL